MSLVTYDHGILNATIFNSTVLSSQNANLALFLTAVINYQSSNPKNLVANSIGDALYSIAVTTTTSLSHFGPLDRRLLEELEQYWRGVIGFSGTYLRPGFSASPIKIPSDGLLTINGTHTVVTMGCSLTLTAIGYSLWHIFAERRRGHKFATFGPTDPIHLIMVSSMREFGGKEAWDLEGETLGGFDVFGIQENEDLRSSSPTWIVLTSDCANVL